jgi:hypothetical protein
MVKLQALSGKRDARGASLGCSCAAGCQSSRASQALNPKSGVGSYARRFSLP